MAAKILTTLPAASTMAVPQSSLEDLHGKIVRIIAGSETWLNTPHPLLADHKPVDFLQTGRERPLRDLVAAIEYGLFT